MSYPVRILTQTAVCFRLMERQYGESEFADVRLTGDRHHDDTFGKARQQMDARCWYWHTERGAVIEMDADGMGFKAVCRDGAKTVLAEVRIQEML